MKLLYEELTGSLLLGAFDVDTSSGQELLESAYEECLHYELDKAGLQVIKQKPLTLKPT